MHFRAFFIFLVSFLFPLATEAFAEQSNSQGDLHLTFPSQSVSPGSEVEGIIRFSMQPGQHTYWKNPGGVGLAPSFDWELPNGVEVKELSWPTPSLLKEAGNSLYGYENSPEWIVKLSFDKDMSPDTYKIRLTSFFLTCDGMCTPVTAQGEYDFTVSPSAPKNLAWDILKVASSKIPTPLLSGKAILENKSLSFTLPLSEIQTAFAKEIILFPEKEGFFSPGTPPTWKRDETSLFITIALKQEGIEKLREKKEFSGLVQILFKDTKATYSIKVPVELSIPTEKASELTPKLWKEKNISQEQIFSLLPTSLQAILLAAFLGGLLTNITPCVLPIVGLKLLHLLSFKDKRSTMLHGLTFTLGILIAFWVLAAVLYSLQHIGGKIGWGFQMQEPLFVSALILILFFFSLNLFGIFELGTTLSSWAGTVENSYARAPSYLSSFVSGLFATIIATPCTGPLLGSVLGFAATFEPRDGFLLFTCIGLGMASPFLLVTLFPPLLRLFPRPGEWMITLKQFFGFCGLATVIWLLWVLQSEVQSLSLLLVLSSFFLLSLGAWIFGRWGSAQKAWPIQLFSYLLFFVISLLGVTCFLLSFDSKIISFAEKYVPKHTSIPWKPYSKNALELELRKGHTVFISFTANWCLTCQLNKVVFLMPDVVNAFKQNKITTLYADWTNGDAEITEMLRSLGRNGVPVSAIFQHDKEPVLLPEVLSSKILIQALSHTKEELSSP